MYSMYVLSKLYKIAPNDLAVFEISVPIRLKISAKQCCNLICLVIFIIILYLKGFEFISESSVSGSHRESHGKASV